MNFRFGFVILILILLISNAVIGAPVIGDAATGRSKASVCASCHSTDGNSPSPIWPKLAGQHASYLNKQLHDFKKGEDGPRYNPTMFGMTLVLSDQNMADLSAYYAGQKVSPGTTDDKFLALGQRLYRAGDTKKGISACTACHTPTGAGNGPADFPAVSGQYADYSIAQMKAFRSGERHNDLNGMMRDIAKRMSDEEIEAVANYMQGLS